MAYGRSLNRNPAGKCNAELLLIMCVANRNLGHVLYQSYQEGNHLKIDSDILYVYLFYLMAATPLMQIKTKAGMKVSCVLTGQSLDNNTVVLCALEVIEGDCG